MRKIVFSIIIVILLVAGGFLIAKGANIGNFTVWGVKSIKEKNATIDQKNQQLSTLATTDYEGALSGLNTSKTTLESTKKSYEDKAILANNNSYLQTEKYEIEFLWTKVGNYAKDRNVELKFDVANSSTKGLYDLKFTIAGKYVKVADYIYDIENDSKLGFKIEDFHMVSAGEGVQATFTCKEVNINIESAESNTSSSTENNGTTGKNNTTTNTTTNNTTGGSTNTTNTTNTTTGTNTVSNSTANDTANEVAAQ